MPEWQMVSHWWMSLVGLSISTGYRPGYEILISAGAVSV